METIEELKAELKKAKQELGELYRLGDDITAEYLEKEIDEMEERLARILNGQETLGGKRSHAERQHDEFMFGEGGAKAMDDIIDFIEEKN